MAKPKNPSNVKKIQALLGRKPNGVKARLNQIYKLVSMYGLDSRKYHDDHWQALNDYDKVISSLDCEFTYWCNDGGYTDRDKNDGMPRSKVYNIRITYPDGMMIEGYIKMMAAGTVDDPFDAYDTCIIMWPKQNNTITEGKMKIRLTESDLHRIVKESVQRILKEEVDLGQIDAMRDRPRAKELPIEAKKEIRRLRRLIDDYELEGKDTTALTNAIRKIKNNATV